MSNDFFSSTPSANNSAYDPDDNDNFAHAIALRFGAADLRTPRLTSDNLPPTNPHPSIPTHPLTFSALPPSALSSCLADPFTLVLDIRPHAAHAAARLHHALSLSVPTTLLKRPLYSLSKLSLMLPSPSSRARFSNWSNASCILVYDSDSLVSPDNSVIAGLLRKFRAEGFVRDLAWVRGGFQAVWREARHLTTTEPPPQEEDDQDATSSSGALRTTHLPKAAFSLFSTTAAPAPPPPGSQPFINTPAPSAARAANPFFDTIRQNVELSHGITERIPLRLPRRVRRRIHDLPFPWLQDIAHRSALRHRSASRHPGLDTLESGSESSDDPHTSDPDEHDPNVEEGTEALAMQFYRIELAEQRRLRSIMEHHSKESQVPSSVKPRIAVGADHVQGRVSLPSGAKSVPGTPYPTPFPFSITAGVEKGTKNRYNHIWPFEHARVRLHDGRHQGSHPSKRSKSRTSDRGRTARDRSRDKTREREDQVQDSEMQRRSRSNPASDKIDSQEVTGVVSASSRHSFYFEPRSSSINGTRAGFEAGQFRAALRPSPTVPRVQIEYDVTDQDCRTSGPPTPVTAFPLPTPPFYTPMEISPGPTPVRLRPPQLLSLPSLISPSLGPLPSFPLRLPNRLGGLPSIGEQTLASESLSSSVAPPSSVTTTIGEAEIDTGIRHDPRRAPSPVDDYVNASYVQPLGTRKRYIATQGPLPSTYVDFWTLVWEQNVHVIVMLTREVENAMVKCGSYWTDTDYGLLRLELLSTSPPMSVSTNTMSADISPQGFFTIREPQGKSVVCRTQPTLITRIFALSHKSYPGVPPRKITHLQYLDWSDMNVPDDPRGVLDLVEKVEQTVGESTPGPSPSGSLSPGSTTGSPLTQSPDAGLEHGGYDMSLLSPTSAGTMPGGRSRRRGSEWRHSELDAKTGIATFALRRTGGFIAVDAVLDGIRREMRRNREDRSLRMAPRANVVSAEGKATNAKDLSVEKTKAGDTVQTSGKKSILDEIGCMVVDAPDVGGAQKLLPLINTVPIHVSAGDCTKGRRHHYRSKGISGEKESLVVHVPYAGSEEVPEGPNVASIDLGDPKKPNCQSSSTRDWVEQVSDQTHDEEGEHPPPSSLPLSSSRERSPESASNISDPSALDSADDSMSGSASANASGSGSGVEWKDGKDNANGSGSGIGSGSGDPAQVSKPGSGSISLSNSGSGTGTGSRFGSSMLHVGLRDSSVTSISAESTDSLSPKQEPKSNALLHRPTAIHTSSSSDMEIDCPPRPFSVPLAPVRSSTISLQRTVHARHHKPTLGSSQVVSLSSPTLPPGTREGSTPRPSSELDADELRSPLQEYESGGSADAERSGKNSQVRSDESGRPVAPTKPGSNLRLNTDLSSLKLSCNQNQRKDADSTVHPGQSSAKTDSECTWDSCPSKHEQVAPDLPVIDYKLPRALHTDLSPPLISSFEEPICMVIQDMREQRMSLCQSLRQYVFVHAAVIEGALRIVDEERELLGSGGTSDDPSSAEGELGTGIRTGGQRFGYNEGLKMWVGEAEDAVMASEAGYGANRHRTPPSHINAQSSTPWSPEGKTGGGQVPLAPASSSSGISSPSKGKRGPSPTELLREDKTGALSLNKRPSIHRNTVIDDGDPLALESSRSSPAASENGGGPRDSHGWEYDSIHTTTTSSTRKGTYTSGTR
ncbi:hypothetical protein JVU11DRAFT_5525 [Chiua virens]|nr:hypothetical protein JVU11DRAFT_5525 [Chiua virens]